MHGNRLLRGVAVLIMIVAGVYFVLALGGALMLGGRGFGSGWGTGSNLWLVLPLAGAAIMAALTLLVFGLMLFFLAKIDDNLVAARQQKQVQPKPKATPAAPFASAPATSTPAVAGTAAAAPVAAGAAVVAGAVVAAERDQEAAPVEPALEVQPELPPAAAAAAVTAAAIAAEEGRAEPGAAEPPAVEVLPEVELPPAGVEAAVVAGAVAAEERADTPAEPVLAEADLEPEITRGGTPATVEFEGETPPFEPEVAAAAVAAAVVSEPEGEVPVEPEAAAAFEPPVEPEIAPEAAAAAVAAAVVSEPEAEVAIEPEAAALLEPVVEPEAEQPAEEARVPLAPFQTAATAALVAAGAMAVANEAAERTDDVAEEGEERGLAAEAAVVAAAVAAPDREGEPELVASEAGEGVMPSAEIVEEAPAETETPDIELRRVELAEVAPEAPEITAAGAAFLAAGVEQVERAAPEETLPEAIPLETEFVEPEARLTEIIVPEEPAEGTAPEIELPRVDLEGAEPALETEDMAGPAEPAAVEFAAAGIVASEVAGLEEEAEAAEPAEVEGRLPQVEFGEVTGAAPEQAEVVAAASEEAGVPEPELTSGVPAEPAEEPAGPELPPFVASPVETRNPAELEAEIAALRAQLAALQAQLGAGAAVAAAAGAVGRTAEPEPEELAAELPDEPPTEPAEPSAGKLPGSDEVARIAAEMAAVKRGSQAVPVEPPPAPETSQAPGEDNLEIIEGVGPIYAKRLREEGITTYKQLTEATYEQLVRVTRGNLERVVKEDWRGQARRLMGQK